MARNLFLVATLTLGSLILASACGDDAESSSKGGGGSGGSGEAYGASPCGLCVKDACAAEIDACSADPGCAQYLTCLYACPLDATGNADPACADACGVPDSSTAQAARSAVEACRAYGAGALDCPACGISGNTHPLLNQDCPASQEVNACFKCEDEHCCETYAACKSDPECDALVTCIQACPDATYDACKADCEAAHPAGVAGFGARLGCLMVLCVEPCAGVPPTPCAECVNTRCGDEFITCWSNPECYHLFDCTTPCSPDDQPCFDACFAAHPAGVQDFNNYALCSTQACSAECG